MAKKLQVFISSTYSDLREERQSAVAAVLLAGHIPAGMELFTAGDQAQLDVIKRWIRDSDVYMLICGSRYGSLEPKSGLGYTELEYDYASELQKPSFAMVMSGALYESALKSHPGTGCEKQSQFREKVLSKISWPFESCDAMKLGIVTALKDIAEREGHIGWVRGNEMSDVQPLIREIEALQKERDGLRLALSATPVSQLSGKPLAGLDESYPLRFTWEFELYRGSSEVRRKSETITWGELFSVIAPRLAQFPADSILNVYVAKHFITRNNQNVASKCSGCMVDSFDWDTVRNQFEALGFITLQYAQSTGGKMHVYWHATQAGRETGLQLRAVYANKLISVAAPAPQSGS